MGSFEDNQNISFLGTKNALNKPVVEQYSEYVGVFKGIGSSSPMLIDNSSFFLTYVIDSQGNPTKVPAEGSILTDITTNFSDNPFVITRVDQPTQLNENLAGEQKVTSVGTLTPLLYTQIGEGVNDNVESISLLPPGIEPENIAGLGNYLVELNKTDLETLNDMGFEGDFVYLSDFQATTPSSFDTNVISVDLGTPLTGTGSITLVDPSQEPDALAYLIFGVTLSLRSRGLTLNLNPGESANFTLSIILERADGSRPYAPVAQSRILSRPDEGSSGEVFRGGGTEDQSGEDTDWFTANFDLNWLAYRNQFEAGDKIFVSLVREEGDYFIPQIAAARFSIQYQNPPPASPTNFTNQTPYWETGSTTVLTASAYLSEQYGNIQRELTASLDFGFPPIKDPFLVQKGDKIRFQFNEANTFSVYEVIPPSSLAASGSRLYLRLNEEVPPNINTNNFVLYNINRDGQFITIDAKKNENENTEFTGLVIPKYVNPDFKSNLNNIVQQLKQDGIIEE